MRGKRSKALRKQAAGFRSALFMDKQIPLTKKESEQIVKRAFYDAKKPKGNRYDVPRKKVFLNATVPGNAVDVTAGWDQ